MSIRNSLIVVVLTPRQILRFTTQQETSPQLGLEAVNLGGKRFFWDEQARIGPCLNMNLNLNMNLHVNFRRSQGFKFMFK